MAKRAAKAIPQIRIKWVKSAIGAQRAHKRTIKALGLKRLQSEVVHAATPQVVGMARSVSHLVRVTEVSD